MAERSAEQQSALSKSAGLLDSMRKRFGTPGGGATPAAPHAADPLATPRAALIAAGLPPTQPPPSAAAGATPRPASGAALKENLAAELNRSLGATPFAGGAAAAPPTGASSFAAAAAVAAMGGGPGDSALQQASNLFLQQVEGMRRKYTAEVDRLKVRRRCARVLAACLGERAAWLGAAAVLHAAGSACLAPCQSLKLPAGPPTPPQEEVEGLTRERDSLAAEVATAGASAKSLRVQVSAAQRELEAVTADLQRAQARLASLEAAQRAEQERYQKERAAATAVAEREAAAQAQRLASEREAAAAAVRRGEEELAARAAALEQRAARIEEQGRALVDRDAELAAREREFEAQVRGRMCWVAVVWCLGVWVVQWAVLLMPCMAAAVAAQRAACAAPLVTPCRSRLPCRWPRSRPPSRSGRPKRGLPRMWRPPTWPVRSG